MGNKHLPKEEQSASVRRLHLPTKEEMKKYCANMNCRDCPINTCKWGKSDIFMGDNE